MENSGSAPCSGCGSAYPYHECECATIPILNPEEAEQSNRLLAKEAKPFEPAQLLREIQEDTAANVGNLSPTLWRYLDSTWNLSPTSEQLSSHELDTDQEIYHLGCMLRGDDLIAWASLEEMPRQIPFDREACPTFGLNSDQMGFNLRSGGESSESANWKDETPDSLLTSLVNDAAQLLKNVCGFENIDHLDEDMILTLLNFLSSEMQSECLNQTRNSNPTWDYEIAWLLWALDNAFEMATSMAAYERWSTNTSYHAASCSHQGNHYGEDIGTCPHFQYIWW